MPVVNPELLVWARETAGLTRNEAAARLGLGDARGVPAVERLASMEDGDVPPSRALLARMARTYRRPLVAFYMSAPPRKGDRGGDFRTIPVDQRSASQDALVDALIRDVRARQALVRALLKDEEDTAPIEFVGSMSVMDGVVGVLRSMSQTLGIDIQSYRNKPNPEKSFDYLRQKAEGNGVFVLLIGNLGSHHTAIDVETFRGFALADEIAPFVVINDQDATSAWSFTLLHELAHIWLGSTGVSGGNFTGAAIERFCNDVASEFLLPSGELTDLPVNGRTGRETAYRLIDEFAKDRNISRSMVAYKLLRNNRIDEPTWHQLREFFRQKWVESREAYRERSREKEGGPNYYVVRRHRIGNALVNFVRRMMADGALSPTKAGKVLGVKPMSVPALLGGLEPQGRRGGPA